MGNNPVDMNSVLLQMRQARNQIRANHENQMNAAALKNDVANPVNPIANSQATESVNTTPNFQDMFANAIDSVNANQKAAGQLATRFEQGDPSVDLPEVMIAMQKSSVSFQAMTEVRNKLVEAYREIMSMPV